MALTNRDRITLENVEIPFSNFSGKKTEFNNEGNRNFSIFLSPEEAESMLADGWNVKFLKLREDDEPFHPTLTDRRGNPVGRAYLQIKVSYDNKPPKVVVVTSRAANVWDESVIENLDYVDIKSVDVTIVPYIWDVQGNTGVKAYLKTMYLTIDEDPLDLKYAPMMEEMKAISSGSEYEDDIIDGEVVELRELGG